jgi:hypothetical protein
MRRSVGSLPSINFDGPLLAFAGTVMPPFFCASNREKESCNIVDPTADVVWESVGTVYN